VRGGGLERSDSSTEKRSDNKNNVVPFFKNPFSSSQRSSHKPPTHTNNLALVASLLAQMNLTFAEPVNITTFKAASIQFQADTNLGINPHANTIALTNTNVTELSGHGNTVAFNIGTYNLNRIKALYPLGTEHSLLYLSMSASCIKDIAGNDNSLAYVSIYEGKNPTSYVPDTTIPYLEHYDLNMNAETLTLYFTETINAFQLTVEGITIQETTNRNAATYFNLTTASIKASTDPQWTVIVNLGKPDLHAIKLLDMAVASEDAKTYITFKSSLTRDMSESPHLEILPLVDNVNPMNVYQFTPDTTKPMLISYVLDMNYRKLIMTFDEPVRSNTLLVTYLTLQDNIDVSTNGGNKVSLTSESNTTSPNGLVISINLCDADFNSLKLLPAMAISSVTTFLTYADFNGLNAIQDMIIPANNLAQILDGQATNPATFVSDQARPSLRNYTINMNTGALNLTFSEPCDASTLNVSKIVFQNQEQQVVCNAFGQCSVAGQSASNEHRLRSSTVVNVDALTLSVKVSADDMNAIKVIDGFFSNLATSYLAANQDMVMDIADYNSGSLSQNGVNQVPVSNAMHALSWAPDTTDPEVSTFSLDMDKGVLALTFDEPVRASTFNATGITLHSDANNKANTSSVSLSKESITTSPDHLTQSCAISYDDLNALKLKTNVFTSAETTFLSTLPLTVEDMAGPPGNPLHMATSAPKQAFLHTPDITQPRLLSFDFDPVNHNFTFHFDEPVMVSTFAPTTLTIQDLAFASLQVTLVDAVAIGSDGISISAYFGPQDKSNFASAGTFFNIASNTFIRFTNGLIKDVAGTPNTVVSLSDGNALQIGPTLFRFEIDMDKGLLKMRFSEPVQERTLDPTKIILQDAAEATTSYTLTGLVSTYMLHNNYTVAAYLTATDLNAIKALPTLCYSLSNTYIRFGIGAIKDVVEGTFMGPNDLLGIADGSAIGAVAFVADATTVEVVNFSLDMNAATLTINFNEPVLASSLDSTKMTLHGARDGTQASTNFYTLTSASATSSANGMQIVINIENNGGLDQDFDEIQYQIQLATELGNTFLSMTKEAVIDMSSNYNQLVPISTTNCTKALSFTADVTMPTLQSFGIDMDAKTIAMTFSEAVWVDSSFDVTAVTFQNSATFSTSDYTLTTDTVVSSETYSLAASKSVPAVAVVKLTIGDTDLDAIKSARYLAADISSTFVSIETKLAKDISPNNNTFTSIAPTAALQASTFAGDTVSPNLLTYALDMDSGSMTFNFDEMVDPLTLDPTQLTIQYALFTGTNAQKFTLQTSTITGSSTAGARSLGISLSAADLNNIKVLTGLATQVSNTYAVVTGYFVKDMSANAITGLRDGKAQLLSTYTADTTRPIIKSFQLRTNGKIILRFSEAVWSTSFNSSALIISDISQTATYPLTAFTTVTLIESIGTQLTLSLGSDLGFMQGAGVGVSQLTSYLSCSEYVITDFSGNKVVPIPANEAVLMGPALDSFDLNMDKNFITMRFTEDLYGNFTAGAITIISGQSGGFSYTLTDWNHTTHFLEPYQPSLFVKPVSATVKAFLHPTDVENLKKIGNVASEKANTYVVLGSSPYLAVNEDTTSVGSPLFVVPITSAKAMQVTSYTGDIEKPTLTGYDVSRNSGVLTMRFSEPVSLKQLNLTSITLQALEERGTGTGFVTLGATGTAIVESLTPSTGSSTVNVQLGQSDLGKVRSLGLGAYLTLTETSAHDMSVPPNRIVPINDGSAMAVTTLSPDTTGPAIVSYSLDLDAGTLTLVFDEPVKTSFIKPDFFSLQGVAANPNGQAGMYNLTADTVVTSNVEETVVLDLSIFRTDLDGIKSSMVNNVAGSLSTTFLSVKASAFEDYNSNAGTQIPASGALQASAYQADTLKPLLKSFDFEVADNTDLKYGKLTLHFSEPVDPGSFVFASFVLSDGASSSADTNTVSLAASSAGATASSSIDITLDAGDLTTIQGYSWSTTFLTIATDAAADVSGNLLAAVDHIMIGPVLEYSTFTMAKGVEVIKFIFSEPIDPTTFDPTGITIHSATTGGSSYTLTSVTTLSSTTLGQASTKFLEVELGAKDITALKTLDGLAISAASSLIVLEGKTILDTAATANQAVPTTQSNAVAVNSYTVDSSEPVLNTLRLDLSLNEITFFFDEPVLASSLNPSQITLQSKATRTGSLDYWTFTDTAYYGGNNDTIHMNLGFNDLSNIKSKKNLCTNVTDCYVALTADTFVDTAESANSLPIVRPTAARQLDQVLADTKDPNLLAYTLDLDNDKLSLNFDEPVTFSTFIPRLFTMQKNKNNIGTTIFSLPQTSPVSTSNGLESSSTLVVDLPVEFIEAVVLDTAFAVDKFTVFLMLEDGSVKDTSGNNVTALPNGFGMAATYYVPDTTPPSLQKFELDMDLGTATLVFDEFVKVRNIDITAMSLTNGTSEGAISHSLTLGSSLQQNVNNSKSVIVVLSSAELNAIKEVTDLAVSKNSSRIKLAGNSVFDMSNNGNSAMDNSGSFGSTKYTVDQTTPKLLQFDLNLNTGQLSLRFSETINTGTFDIKGLKLHNFAIKRYGNVFDLISPTISSATGSESNEIYLDLGADDMASLQDKGIGLSRNTTWLSMDKGTVNDMVGLGVDAIIEKGIVGGKSLRVFNLVLDFVAPKVSRWRLNRMGKNLHMFASEPINVIEWDYIRLENAAGAYVTMTNASYSYKQDSTEVVINVDR